MVRFLWSRILIVSALSACMMVCATPIAISQSGHERHAVADVSTANRLRRQIFFKDYVDTEEYASACGDTVYLLNYGRDADILKSVHGE
ncbi:hypothetical protein B0H17DRAFT_1067721 [Mycena rosella]|uniref:Uncharacterized protein n=1 Tax=Mycena rosella TaxID=1033263 RepID=A0AAD7GD60_MYCRO|nr:hypothetical protein B0H17DRAFT_1067721 [Mycena rosella]